MSYSAKKVEQFPGVEKRSFDLVSQTWPGNGLATPAQWMHEVNIYIPADPRPQRALLAANNGTNHAGPAGSASAPTDLSESMLLSVARKTQTIVISVSNIPNQYLVYDDDGIARKEDDSVAHSWKLFLDSPQTRPLMSLHIPMMEAIIKAMDLAQRELQPWQVQHFIATGGSKRAWAAWLAAIADQRIDAIVPFVLDFLNMDRALEHTFNSYGGSWPLAFSAYHAEGITGQFRSENFDKLLRIEDPMRYLQSAYAQRLSIPKYIVNASSDDFFVPDNARFYFDQLPGPKALRVAPNASHYGIREFIETSLVTAVRRLQQNQEFPAIDMRPDPDGGLSLHFSEPPRKITQWSALNPLARDFRYPCGIRYQPTDIVPSAAQSAKAVIKMPAQGWAATFIEAEFADGFVATTPVIIVPDNYPTAPPPSVEPACKSLAAIP